MLLLTVGQLAEELDRPVEEVIEACHRHGVSVFSDRSPLTGGEAQKVRAELVATDPEATPEQAPKRRRRRAAAEPTADRPARTGPHPLRRVGATVLRLLAVAGIAAGVWYVVDRARDDDGVGPEDVAVATVPPDPTTTAPPPTSSPSSTAPPTTLAPRFAPTVGQCWLGRDAPAIVDCAGPHEGEVYGVFDHPAAATDPYPGQAAVVEFADAQCSFRFEGFVGTFVDRSVLDIHEFLPDEAHWDAGSRTVVCSVVNRDGTSLVGTAAGSRR